MSIPLPRILVERAVDKLVIGAANGCLIGLCIASVALRSFMRYAETSSTLSKIRAAPYVKPSGIRSIITSDCESGQLVLVRAVVEAKSAVEKEYLEDCDFVLSEETGERALLVEKTQSFVYVEWKSLLGWLFDLRSLFLPKNEFISLSTTKVPFILVEKGKLPESEYIVVDMEGCSHRLPLEVFHHQQLFLKSPIAFIQSLLGLEYPVGVLREEKILPPGIDVTALGICSMKNGIPEIRSCSELPYFLSDLTKDEMVTNLASQSSRLMWGGLILGSISIVILYFSISRSWMQWKDHQFGAETFKEEVEEEEDVPDGGTCVVCLIRRRRFAFVPCGHMVCCKECASTIGGNATHLCPVCRTVATSSIRIYDA